MLEATGLKEAKEIEIGGKRFIISKFPAVAGREIVAKYPLSGLPKLGDYAVNEETMLKLMTYVAVPTGETTFQRLLTRALVDSHLPDWEVLARVEIAMMEYNCSFFQSGRLSTFFEGIAQKLPAMITRILTECLERLSKAEKPVSTN